MESTRDAPRNAQRNRPQVRQSARRISIVGLVCWSIGVGLWEWS